MESIVQEQRVKEVRLLNQMHYAQLTSQSSLTTRQSNGKVSLNDESLILLAKAVNAGWLKLTHVPRVTALFAEFFKIRGVTDIAGRGHGSRSWLREVEGCCFCNKLKKVLPDGTEEATRCCAGKICKRGMHSTCWEERGGSPLPLDPHGKSVFWSCADLDAQIRPWKSYCKSLAEFPGVGPSS